MHAAMSVVCWNKFKRTSSERNNVIITSVNNLQMLQHFRQAKIPIHDKGSQWVQEAKFRHPPCYTRLFHFVSFFFHYSQSLYFSGGGAGNKHYTTDFSWTNKQIWWSETRDDLRRTSEAHEMWSTHSLLRTIIHSNQNLLSAWLHPQTEGQSSLFRAGPKSERRCRRPPALSRPSAVRNNIERQWMYSCCR